MLNSFESIKKYQVYILSDYKCWSYGDVSRKPKEYISHQIKTLWIERNIKESLNN